MPREAVIISMSDEGLVQCGLDPKTITDEEFERIAEVFRENLFENTINYLDCLAEAIQDAQKA